VLNRLWQTWCQRHILRHLFPCFIHCSYLAVCGCTASTKEARRCIEGVLPIGSRALTQLGLFELNLPGHYRPRRHRNERGSEGNADGTATGVSPLNSLTYLRRCCYTSAT
jgi:hypothetical protein